jgi:hypothetical protein
MATFVRPTDQTPGLEHYPYIQSYIPIDKKPLTDRLYETQSKLACELSDPILRFD